MRCYTFCQHSTGIAELAHFSFFSHMQAHRGKDWYWSSLWNYRCMHREGVSPNFMMQQTLRNCTGSWAEGDGRRQARMSSADHFCQKRSSWCSSFYAAYLPPLCLTKRPHSVSHAYQQATTATTPPPPKKKKNDNHRQYSTAQMDQAAVHAWESPAASARGTAGPSSHQAVGKAGHCENKKEALTTRASIDGERDKMVMLPAPSRHELRA